MNNEFNPRAVSIAFRFYSRVMVFPYDELTYEFQNLLRELEKNIETDVDSTVAASILDVLNFYQGEEMQALQAEYTRMFTPIGETLPLIPVSLSKLSPGTNTEALLDKLYDSALILDLEDYPDSFVNIMDYLAYLLEEDMQEANEFFEDYIKPEFPELCRHLHQGSTLGFYKEAAKGLDEMIRLIE